MPGVILRELIVLINIYFNLAAEYQILYIHLDNIVFIKLEISIILLEIEGIVGH